MCVFSLVLQIPVVKHTFFFVHENMLEGFVHPDSPPNVSMWDLDIENHHLTIVFMCHTKELSQLSRRIWHSIVESTHLPAWLMQSLSVSRSSLWTAGQCMHFFYVFIHVWKHKQEHIVLTMFIFSGGSDTLANTVLSAMLCLEICCARRSMISSYCKRFVACYNVIKSCI